MEQDNKTYIPLDISFQKYSINSNEGSCLNVITPHVSHSNSSIDRYVNSMSLNNT